MIQVLGSVPAQVLLGAACLAGWVLGVLASPSPARRAIMKSLAAVALVWASVTVAWTLLTVGLFWSEFLWIFSAGFPFASAVAMLASFAGTSYVLRATRPRELRRFFGTLAVLGVSVLGAAYIAAPAVVEKYNVPRWNLSFFVAGVERAEFNLTWSGSSSNVAPNRLGPTGPYAIALRPTIGVHVTGTPGSTATVALRTDLPSLLYGEVQSQGTMETRRVVSDEESYWRVGTRGPDGCNAPPDDSTGGWSGGVVTVSMLLDAAGSADFAIDGERSVEMVARDDADYILNLPAISAPLVEPDECLIGYGDWSGVWDGPRAIQVNIQDPSVRWPVGPVERGYEDSYVDTSGADPFWSFVMEADDPARFGGDSGSVGSIPIVAVDAVPSTNSELNLFLAALVGSISAAAIWDLVNRWPKTSPSSPPSERRRPRPSTARDRFLRRFRSRIDVRR